MSVYRKFFCAVVWPFYFLRKTHASFQSQSVSDKNGILQTIVLLLTFIAAVWIGKTQNEINLRMMNINYNPVLSIIYDSSEKAIFLVNRGKTNIVYLGYDCGIERIMKDKPIILLPDSLIRESHLYFDLKQQIDKLYGGHHSMICKLFIKMENNDKYLIMTGFEISAAHGSGSVTQRPVSIFPASDVPKDLLPDNF